MDRKSQSSAGTLWAAFALALTTSCVLLTAASIVAQQTTAPVATPANERALSAAEKRGKTIYLRGESPSGREITAMLNDIDVPASTLSCAGCHGLRDRESSAREPRRPCGQGRRGVDRLHRRGVVPGRSGQRGGRGQRFRRQGHTGRTCVVGRVLGSANELLRIEYREGWTL